VNQAIVRTISRSLGECELLHLPRLTFDLARARAQHEGYVAALRSAGIRVTVLPEEPDLPDATFVEDPAVVFDEFALLGRMGVPSREPEMELMARALSGLRMLRRITPPGTLEGGDILQAGRTIFAGLSTRTNPEGVRQLAGFARPFGYQVKPVSIRGCLHLKTACTLVDDRLILANPDWIDPAEFEGFEVLPVAHEEPWAANTLSINGTLFVADGCPRTEALLRSRGLNLRSLDISELQKAEAGLTCHSLVFRERLKAKGSDE
jgi:dimethylargininase